MTGRAWCGLRSEWNRRWRQQSHLKNTPGSEDKMVVTKGLGGWGVKRVCSRCSVVNNEKYEQVDETEWTHAQLQVQDKETTLLEVHEEGRRKGWHTQEVEGIIFCGTKASSTEMGSKVQVRQWCTQHRREGTGRDFTSNVLYSTTKPREESEADAMVG